MTDPPIELALPCVLSGTSWIASYKLQSPN